MRSARSPFTFVCLALVASVSAAACGEDATIGGTPVDDATVRGPDATPGKADGPPVEPADVARPPGPDAVTALVPDATPPLPPDAASGPVPDADTPPETDAAPDAGPAPDPVPACPEPALGPAAEWRHGFASPATVGLGLPQHSAVEPITTPGEPITVAGKFAYGLVSKDLEDEDVELWVSLPSPEDPDCGRWTAVGVATTDSDGRAVVPLDPALVPEPGAYDFRFVVRGDLTVARGAVWVVSPGTAFVLFDVDGTLTIGDSEIFEQVLLGQDPEMYAAADVVVATYAEAGYQPLYVTGRPYFLNPATRDWLLGHGFPKGPVRTADSMSQVLPTEDGVQRYKRAYLQDLLERTGVIIPYAYGNASTDICAYAEAGLDPAQTYIIGPHAGEACAGYGPTVAVEDYPGHLPALADLPPPR
ncbi:hypothetical protein L6V77_16105 [Myxococcota bacterium]|nr:hypothetical protein [Myxococcota bacterium]